MPKKINYHTKAKAMKLTALNELDSSLPFSESLNELILKAFHRIFMRDNPNISVHFVDAQPYATFEAMKADIEKNEQLYISTQFCENTIFGNPLVNQMFRAVHDWLHYSFNLDFEHGNEAILNYHQHKAFKRLGARQYDLDLLHIETVGQIQYHLTNGFFPHDQRLFVFGELKEMGY